MIKMGFNFCNFNLPFDNELRRLSGKPLNNYSPNTMVIVIDDLFEKIVMQYPHKLEIPKQNAWQFIQKIEEMRNELNDHCIQSRIIAFYYCNSDGEPEEMKFFYLFKDGLDASAGRVLL